MICPHPRPSDHADDSRQLALIEPGWEAPSGDTGELIVEPHDDDQDHVHVWFRWGGRWDWPMTGGDDDWQHVRACVWPVLREVVEAFCGSRPLDTGSAEMRAELEARPS